MGVLDEEPRSNEGRRSSVARKTLREMGDREDRSKEVEEGRRKRSGEVGWERRRVEDLETLEIAATASPLC